MQTVKIQTTNERTHIFIGDCELKRVVSASYEQTASTVPCFAFETVGFPDIVIENADIRFKFVPETVSDAAKVICNTYKSDSNFRNAFITSIASAIKELSIVASSYDAAKAVADRIMGVEND